MLFFCSQPAEASLETAFFEFFELFKAGTYQISDIELSFFCRTKKKVRDLHDIEGPPGGMLVGFWGPLGCPHFRL